MELDGGRHVIVQGGLGRGSEVAARIFVLARFQCFGFTILFEVSFHFFPGYTTHRASVGTRHWKQLTLDVVGLEGVCSEATGTVTARHKTLRTSIDLENERSCYSQ